MEITKNKMKEVLKIALCMQFAFVQKEEILRKGIG